MVVSKNVTGIGKDEYEVGDVCFVRLQNGSKAMKYRAMILGIGKKTLQVSSFTMSIYYGEL